MPEANPPSAPTATAVAGGEGGETFARLHISPFDPDLLKVVVPAAALPKARNVSFHTIQTFPENRYGYVELPTADAEKVRRKFHGSTLKGIKMRVEKARPEKIWEPDEDQDTGKKRKKTSSGENEGQSKKRKRDHNTVEGFLLPEDRKVKRGWTAGPEERKEKKSKKSKDKDKDMAEKKGKRVKSKYTDKEECLMKIVLPPNAPSAADVTAKNKNKKKKGKLKRQVVVHEFEDTTKFPSFLKGSADAAPVSAVASKLPTWPGVSNATTGEEAKLEDVRAVVNDGGSDSSGEEQATEAPETKPDSDSSDEDSDAGPSAPTNEKKEDIPTSSPASARPRSSGSARNLSIQVPPPTPPAPKEVHPLEALYKKPIDGDNAQATPAAEPFSFFGGDNLDDEDEDEDEDHAPGSQQPMTPFTKQDFEQRYVRSGAPTPDTAHPSRTRMFWAPSGEDDLQEEEEEEPEPETPVKNGNVGPGAGENVAKESEDAKESDFHKWFYENRREINRSWMERRKAAKKEKRQRDNRAKGR